MSLNVIKMQVAVQAQLTQAVGLVAAATVSLAASWNNPLSSGTSTDQADLIYSVHRDIAASSFYDLDLSNSLLDAFGNTIKMVRLKALLVQASSSNSTGDVNVTRESTFGAPVFMAAGDGLALKPRAVFAWWDPGAIGVLVTCSSGDLVHFSTTTSNLGVGVNIIAIGASA